MLVVCVAEMALIFFYGVESIDKFDRLSESQGVRVPGSC